MKSQIIVNGFTDKLLVNAMSFGTWLRDKINSLDISNAEVARRADISPTYVGNLIRDHYPNSLDGTGQPSEETVAALAKALGASLDEARLAAGFAPKNAIPASILEAISAGGDLDNNDIDEIADFIKFKKSQK